MPAFTKLWGFKRPFFVRKEFCMEDEYELVPMNPIRKMEKRLDRVEKNSSGGEMMKELIDVVRTNQQIVDDIVKINSDMIGRVSGLAASVQQMTEKLNEFMNRLEVVGSSAETSVEAPKNDEMERRMEKLEKRINSMVLSSATRRRPMMPGAPQRPL